MKISGSQSAIAEILTLLDPTFLHPFRCRCTNSGANLEKGLLGCHYCECEYQPKLFEETFGPAFHSYEIEYDGTKITKCSGKGRDLGFSSNILSGCVK